jgi:hypothetical protein
MDSNPDSEAFVAAYFEVEVDAPLSTQKVARFVVRDRFLWLSISASRKRLAGNPLKMHRNVVPLFQILPSAH